MGSRQGQSSTLGAMPAAGSGYHGYQHAGAQQAPELHQQHMLDYN